MEDVLDDAILAEYDLLPRLPLEATPGTAAYALAIEVATKIKFATPGRGVSRVQVLRDYGWTHGVCYRLDCQILIGIWSALGKADELWEHMPRRGRPRLDAAEQPAREMACV